VAYREHDGALLIADITGYTDLAGAELAHAQEIISQLLAATIDAAGAAFEVVKLEGDAVFFIVPRSSVSLRELWERVLRMSREFHERQAVLTAQRSCTCRGCACACKLTLKFVGHYGRFGEHEVHGLREVIGSAVVIVHRLLKNGIKHRAYVALTETLVNALNGSDVPPGGERHEEHYEHLGAISVLVWPLAG
jgi:class 3 adenylate cyclase